MIRALSLYESEIKYRFNRENISTKIYVPLRIKLNRTFKMENFPLIKVIRTYLLIRIGDKALVEIFFFTTSSQRALVINHVDDENPNK